MFSILLTFVTYGNMINNEDELTKIALIADIIVITLMVILIYMYNIAKLNCV